MLVILHLLLPCSGPFSALPCTPGAQLLLHHPSVLDPGCPLLSHNGAPVGGWKGQKREAGVYLLLPSSLLHCWGLVLITSLHNYSSGLAARPPWLQPRDSVMLFLPLLLKVQICQWLLAFASVWVPKIPSNLPSSSCTISSLKCLQLNHVSELLFLVGP